MRISSITKNAGKACNNRLYRHIRTFEKIIKNYFVIYVKKENENYMKNMKIDANGTEIRVMGDVVNEEAYISLTDIAKYKNPDNAFIVVANWMRNHSTISFLGLWEQIHNPNFKPIEFDRFKAESGDNAFTLTPQQWIKAMDAIGIVSIQMR